MHALPDDLRTALQLASNEPVRHAAFSSYPSPRGAVETALVVSSRRVFLAAAAPDGEWAVQAHDRTAITGMEMDADGIGEVTIGLLAGDRVEGQLKLARLDRSDFEDAAPFLEADAEEPADTGAEDPFDAPPAVAEIALIPIALASGEAVQFAEPADGDDLDDLIELTPIDDADGLVEIEPVGPEDADDDAQPIAFHRVRGPEGAKCGSRFRFRPDPAAPGERVIVHWHLNWPRDKKVRGVRWELDAREHTAITVTRTYTNSQGRTSTRSTTYRAARRLLRGGATLWGTEAGGFLSNMASGLLSMVGGGDIPVLKAGVYEWQEVITLRQGLPPTYHGTNADVEYDARAVVDVPMGFDHRAGGELQVLPPRVGVLPTRAFWPAGKSGMIDSMRPEVELEVRCHGGRAEPGGELQGEVICINRSGKTIRGIDLVLNQHEYAQARGHTRTSDRSVAEIRIPAPPPEDDTPQAFTFRWPKHIAFYDGQHSNVEYQVAASVDVAWGLDVHCAVAVKFDL